MRVYMIQGMARAEGCKAELEFVIPARQTVCQDIPIINRSDEDWTIKPNLQGQYFSSPFSIIAAAQSVTNFPIMFKPHKAIEVNGLLTLTNMQTSQRYTYNLKGTGLDPLPEETREIHCDLLENVNLSHTYICFNAI